MPFICIACSQDIELPTAQEIADKILKDKAGKEKIRIAYYESFSFRERGGWIFVNPNDTTQLEVVLAPISASDSFQATDTTTIPSINLEDISTNGVPPGQRQIDGAGREVLKKGGCYRGVNPLL